jgi:hypothetical protein
MIWAADMLQGCEVTSPPVVSRQLAGTSRLCRRSWASMYHSPCRLLLLPAICRQHVQRECAWLS